MIPIGPGCIERAVRKRVVVLFDWGLFDGSSSLAGFRHEQLGWPVSPGQRIPVREKLGFDLTGSITNGTTNGEAADRANDLRVLRTLRRSRFLRRRTHDGKAAYDLPAEQLARLPGAEFRLLAAFVLSDEVPRQREAEILRRWDAIESGE